MPQTILVWRDAQRLRLSVPSGLVGGYVIEIDLSAITDPLQRSALRIALAGIPQKQHVTVEVPKEVFHIEAHDFLHEGVP